MSEYITLLGAEDVHRAASTMSFAAEQMQRAAASIDQTLAWFLERFEEQVQRLEAINAEEPDDA